MHVSMAWHGLLPLMARTKGWGEISLSLSLLKEKTGLNLIFWPMYLSKTEKEKEKKEEQQPKKQKQHEFVPTWDEPTDCLLQVLLALAHSHFISLIIIPIELPRLFRQFA